MLALTCLVTRLDNWSFVQFKNDTFSLQGLENQELLFEHAKIKSGTYTTTQVSLQEVGLPVAPEFQPRLTIPFTFLL